MSARSSPTIIPSSLSTFSILVPNARPHSWHSTHYSLCSRVPTSCGRGGALARTFFNSPLNRSAFSSFMIGSRLSHRFTGSSPRDHRQCLGRDRSCGRLTLVTTQSLRLSLRSQLVVIPLGGVNRDSWSRKERLLFSVGRSHPLLRC